MKRTLLLSILFCLPLFSLAESGIKIPVMIGQTGAARLFGAEEYNAYQMAADEWNSRGGLHGQKIEFQIEDTQTSAKHALSALNKISGETSAKVILGPTWLDSLHALLPVAGKQELLFITPSAAYEAFNELEKFRHLTFYFNTSLEIKRLTEFLSENNLDERVLIIYQEDKFSEMLVRVTKQFLPEKKLINILAVKANETQLQSHLLRIKRSKPSSIFLFIWEDSSLISFLKSKNMLIPDVPLITIHDGAGWVQDPDISNYINQLYYSKMLLNNPEFINKYKSLYKKYPQLTAGNAYDAVNSLFRLIEKHGPEILNDSKRIRKLLIENKQKTVTFGEVQLDPAGYIQESKLKVINYQKSSE